MSDARVPVLRRRLQVTRDFRPLRRRQREPRQRLQHRRHAASPPARARSTLREPRSGATCTTRTSTAGVRNFQQRHGLGADGVIGPGTLAAMNVPVQARIDQIRVNLERCALGAARGQGRVRAGRRRRLQRLVFPQRQADLDIARRGRARLRETPIFRSMITYVVFNPTWTIPPGILVKDKLPELRRNPGALAAHEHPRARRQRTRGAIRTRSTGIATATAGCRRISSGRIPGPNNALGTREDHVPESVPRVPARLAGEVAVRRWTSARSARAASACRSRSSWPSWC